MVNKRLITFLCRLKKNFINMFFFYLQNFSIFIYERNVIDCKILPSINIIKKSIRNEKEKYDIFKNFLSDFNNLNKSSLEEVSNFKKLNINFKNNVITNFKNTTEYWSIIYKSNNDSNETSFTENFGYLIDLNRYPVPQYYGQLISDYQIKLIREKNKYKINYINFIKKNL